MEYEDLLGRARWIPAHAFIRLIRNDVWLRICKASLPCGYPYLFSPNDTAFDVR